jgi:hypothetical protein
MITTFDSELDRVSPPLFMLPWIGENYNNTQILFIGESEYDEGTIFHRNWKREWIHLMRILEIKTGSKLLSNIDKTILGDSINKDSQRNLWNSIAYTNLVQRPMNWQENKDDEPSDEDLFLGWQTILETILILKPKIIIKWGIAGHGVIQGNIRNGKYSGWKIDNITNDRFIQLKHQSGFETRILFIHHPSWIFFSASKTRENVIINLPELSEVLC